MREKARNSLLLTALVLAGCQGARAPMGNYGKPAITPYQPYASRAAATLPPPRQQQPAYMPAPQ
ncbi:MAG: hypothetical protein LBO78_00305, partial [Rickettsiales bacterium]|nr:hypothetical protein [Rickettsiales bacterium]